MKDARPITIADAVARLDEFHAILDARSPGEFAEDHLPGALSTPVLSDEERARVGTLHKQENAFAAKRVGAALVSRNIAGIIETRLADAPRDWRPLVYCWRGGNRSGALSTVLARIGWQVCVLEGGYRAFRRQVIDDLNHLPAGLAFVVLAGRTGSGKSLVLERLSALGAQVLDLEALARHRGSVLGHLPGAPQPSQKHFETLLWQHLRGFDPARPVFVESESRKVGQCQVPEQLILKMRASRCLVLEAEDTVRARLLLSEYAHFVQDIELLRHRLGALVALHGHARIGEWLALAQRGQWQDFVVALLREHYDPAYDRSIDRNFSEAACAPRVTLRCADDDGLTLAAQDLLRAASTLTPHCSV